jgi:hypothetical protein
MHPISPGAHTADAITGCIERFPAPFGRRNSFNYMRMFLSANR